MIINNRRVFCVVIQHFSRSFPIPTQMCMLPWFLCGLQGILWHLDVRIGMPRLSLIVTYMFFACHPSSMSSQPTQLCLGCNQIFWFTPCAPHHNHLNCFHLTMGTNLLCLKSITHHGFQSGLKGFECLLPSMVQALPFSLTHYLRIHEILSRKFATYVV